jgi:hypothetical protein
MPPPLIENPYVNGVYYDFTVLKFRMRGTRYFGLQDINYKNSGTFGKVRGTGPYVRGRTSGIVDSEGGFTMYLNEWDAFIEALKKLGKDLGMENAGYMQVPFGLSCSYGNDPDDMRTDDIIGARIKGDDYSHKEGADALVVKVDLDILQVRPGGNAAMGDAPYGEQGD